MARQSKEEKVSIRIRNLHFKVFVFGFSSLFGCNLIQSGPFEALVSWLIFACICLLHYMNFRDTEAKKRAIVDCMFYGTIVIWYVGVIVHYGF